MTQNKNNPGDLIKQYRKKKGYTQESLGDAIGLTQGYISEIENNKKVGAIDALVKICQAIDLSFTEIAYAVGVQEPADSAYDAALSNSPITSNPILNELIKTARSLSDEDLNMLLQMARRCTERN